MKIINEGQLPPPPEDGKFVGTCAACQTEIEGLLSEMRPNPYDADLANVDCPTCGWPRWITCHRASTIPGKAVPESKPRDYSWIVAMLVGFFVTSISLAVWSCLR